MAQTTAGESEDFINRGVSIPGLMSVQFSRISVRGNGLNLGLNQQVSGAVICNIASANGWRVIQVTLTFVAHLALVHQQQHLTSWFA